MIDVVLIIATWLALGLASGIYWCWNADVWHQKDWAIALLLIWLGPLLFPLGTLPWGDHGATWTNRIRRRHLEKEAFEQRDIDHMRRNNAL